MKQPHNPIKLEILLLFTGLAYAFTVMGIVLYFQGFTVQNYDIQALLVAIAILSVIATLKNYIQLKRYGPDLQKYKMFSIGFMSVQSIISSIVFLGIVILFYYAIQIVSFIHPVALLVILGLIGFFVYSRIISNMSLISAGLGIGLLPSFGGIKSITHNFRLLYKINGRKEYHLSSLRLGYWALIIGTLQISNSALYQLVLALGFAAIYINLEKINGSSIIMQIRSIIHDMAPTSLPSLKFQDDNSFIMERLSSDTSENYNHKKRDNSYRNKNTKEERSIITSDKKDLTPIAARSINRIASSILNEKEL